MEACRRSRPSFFQAVWFDVRAISPTYFISFFGLVFVVFLGSISSANAKGWDRFRLRLRLQYAMEYDNNVRRIAVGRPGSFGPQWLQLTGRPIGSRLSPTAVQEDGVHRLGALLRMNYRDRTHLFQGLVGLGYKHFFWVSDEDVLNSRASLTYLLRVHPRLLLGVEGNLLDRRRWNEEREYTSMSGKFQMIWLSPWRLRFTLMGGYRRFGYRNKEEYPEAHLDSISDGKRYSFQGDDYTLQVMRRFGRRWRISGGYGFSRQFYGFRYFLEGTEVRGGLEPRTDLMHSANVEVRFLMTVLVTARYRFEWLLSDSLGESYMGHYGSLLLGVRAFWGFYLVLQGQLQLRLYSDGFSFNHNLFPLNRNPGEDENVASSISVRLSRQLWENITLQVRYSYYSNLFSAGVASYSRQLFSLGFSVRF